MLLRRLTKHIQDQNWFAVGIDFLIVVVGVFIGLQVQEWSAARGDDERLRSQLNSFRTELVMARGDLDDHETYYTARTNAAAELRVRLAMRDPSLTEDEFNRLAFSAILSRSFNISYRNFEELSLSGALARISDDALRDLVFRWDNQLTDIRNLDVSSEEFRATTIVPAYLSTVVFGNSFQKDERYTDVITLTDRFEFDLDAIGANLEFENSLAMRRLLTLQKLEHLREFRVISEDLIAALEDSAP